MDKVTEDKQALDYTRAKLNSKEQLTQKYNKNNISVQPVQEYTYKHRGPTILPIYVQGIQ